MLANPSPREAEMSINELSEYIWAKHIVLVIFFNRFITTLKDMPVMFIAPWSSSKWFELQQYSTQTLDVKERKTPFHESLIYKLKEPFGRSGFHLGSVDIGCNVIEGWESLSPFSLRLSLFLESGLRQLMWVSSELPGRWLGFNHIHIRTRIRTPSDNCPHTCSKFTVCNIGSTKRKYALLWPAPIALIEVAIEYSYASAHVWYSLCDQICGGRASVCGWVRELGVEHSLSTHFCGQQVPHIYILGLSKEC